MSGRVKVYQYFVELYCKDTALFWIYKKYLHLFLKSLQIRIFKAVND